MSADSQPSLAIPLQSAKPGEHARAQLPVAQLAVAFANGMHTSPQPPQFVGESSAASQPSAVVALQFPRPGSQATRAHAPVAQDSLARGTSHTSRHARQSVSVASAVSQPSPGSASQSA